MSATAGPIWEDSDPYQQFGTDVSFADSILARYSSFFLLNPTRATSTQATWSESDNTGSTNSGSTDGSFAAFDTNLFNGLSTTAIGTGAPKTTDTVTLMSHDGSSINWDGDSAAGNFKDRFNWYDNTVPTFTSTVDLHFSFRNSPSQTSLYYDFDSWASVDDILFDTSYGQSTPLNGNGNGLNFNQRLVNNSSYTQTINIPLSGGKNGGSQIELNPVNADLTINGALYNDNNKSYGVYGANNKLLTVNTELRGNSSVGFTIQQNSQVRFEGSAANTYGGATTLHAGTLFLSKDDGVRSISGSSLVVNSTGTVQWEANNQVNSATAVTLNGGRLNLDGRSEYNGTIVAVSAGIGALTLQATSIIDFGALTTGNSILAFANSAGSTWTGGSILNIYNYTGVPFTGNGTDQLYFGTATDGLTNDQLNQIRFYADSGTTFLGTAGWALVGDGEVVPVPEPSTWLAAAFAVGFVGYTQRRRFARLLQRA